MGFEVRKSIGWRPGAAKRNEYRSALPRIRIHYLETISVLRAVSVKKDLGRLIAHAIPAKLTFDQACMREGSFSESYLHSSIHEVATANLSVAEFWIRMNYAHPTLQDVPLPLKKRGAPKERAPTTLGQRSSARATPQRQSPEYSAAANVTSPMLNCRFDCSRCGHAMGSRCIPRSGSGAGKSWKGSQRYSKSCAPALTTAGPGPSG